MATAIPATQAPSPLRSRYDDVFFPAMAAFLLLSVFVGFAKSYYLAGVLKLLPGKALSTPPHALIVHIHAVIFSSWFILLVAQTSLVTRGRADLHRRLGPLVFALACLMMPVGWAVNSENLAMHFPAGAPNIGLASTNVLGVLLFSILVYFGYRERFNRAAHKRLMLVATIQLLPAAVVRWPIPGIGSNMLAPMLCSYGLLSLLAVYDLWSTGNVQRATLWGMTVSNLPFNLLLIQSALWRHFALWMQSMGRLFG